MSKRILIVEDNAEISALVALHVRDMGHVADVVEDGDAGLERALTGSYDLIVLDLTLPGTDGVEICRQVRAAESYVPILMLTARTSEVDRVLGLEIGADDYLTKPFSVRELVARVKALFRRIEALGRPSTERSGKRVIGELAVDEAKRSVTVGERPIKLTAKEFDLLLLFARKPGRVYTRAQLLEQVWGYSHQGYEHTVNSHINRLRSKIEDDPGNPRYLLTVWGVGYRFFDPEQDD